jgi:hypothetical protein
MNGARALSVVPRSVAWTAALLVLYAAVGLAFTHETRTAGLFTAGGTPNLVVVFGAVYLVLRVLARFLVPGLLAYTAAVWVIRRATAGRSEK